MVEHIPLAVDFLYRTVGVVSGIGGDEFRTVLVQHHTARIHQHTTSAPRAERAVAEGIAQGRVGIAQSVFLAAIAREHHHVFVANLTNRRSLEEVEVQRVLTFVQSLILTARLVQQSAVGTAGGNKRVDEFSSLALRVHRLLVELAGRGVLETIEHVGAEAFVEVLVLLVRDVLDEYRRVEVDERAGQTLRAVLRQVHGHEWAVGSVALAYRCHAAPSARVGIQPIGLLACSLVLYFYQVWGKHCVPLAVYEPCEDGPLVAPLRQVLHGCRPHTDVGTAIGRVRQVVRTDNIRTQLTGVVGVFKHAGLTVGQVLPQRQIGVLGREAIRCKAARQENE